MLDDNLYTTPGKFGGGGAGTTWLVGSAEDVAKSLRSTRTSASPTSCSPTPPTCAEIKRQGDQLLPLLRG